MPIEYPVEPVKYNDGNHAINAFCSPIFAMARGNGKKHEKPHMGDARRLKRNMQYAYRQNRLLGPEELKKSFWIGLDHHLGDHTNCDSKWCPIKGGCKTDKIKDKIVLKY